MCPSGVDYNVSEWSGLQCVRVERTIMCQSGVDYNVSEWSGL